MFPESLISKIEVEDEAYSMSEYLGCFDLLTVRKIEDLIPVVDSSMELLPPEKLVAANGWIEGLTVSSIILGTVLGGALVAPNVSAALLALDFPVIDFPIYTSHEAALTVITGLYAIAALFNLRIPHTGAEYEHQQTNPVRLVKDFANCCTVLWKDKLGQISLAITKIISRQQQLCCTTATPGQRVVPGTHQ